MDEARAIPTQGATNHAVFSVLVQRDIFFLIIFFRADNI